MNLKIKAGSLFLDKLFEALCQNEGYLVETDINNAATIKVKEIGVFEYDPSLDNDGKANYCYII